MTAVSVISATPPSIRSRTIFLIASLPMLALYAATRARTVTGEDSGELITAAYQLGVAHPPGYPIWVMLTKLLQMVCGGLNPADAAALGSSITTAAAIGLVAVLAFRLTRSHPAALFGAWSVGLAHEIWNHATIAEVYALNLSILAAALVLFDRFREVPSNRRLFVLSLVYGCGIANHPTFHLFLPLVALGVIAVRPRVLCDWRSYLVALIGLSLPLLSYVQVLIAAANDPFVSWGVVPTLSSVVDHFTRAIYSVGPSKTDLSAYKLFEQLSAQGAFLIENLTLIGAVLAASGLVLLVFRPLVPTRHVRTTGSLLVALVVVGTVGLLPVIPFDVEREDLFASRVFLMPAYLVLGVGLAAVAAFVIRLCAFRARLVLATAFCVIPLFFAATRFHAHDRSAYFFAEDYGRAILADLPKDAVLLPGGDTSTFPLLYLQACLGVRKDVVILDRSGTIERAEALSLLPEPMRESFATAPRDVLVNAILARSGRPVVTIRPEKPPAELDIEYEPFALGFLAIRKGDKAAKEKHAIARDEFFRKLRLRNEAIPTVADYTADVIVSHVAQARAVHLFKSGNPPAGLKQAEIAARAGRGIKETQNNVGSMVAENGLPDRAIPYFREALRIRADYTLARQNLIVVLRGQGDLDGAFQEARFGAELNPEDDFFFEEATALAASLGMGDALHALCARRMVAAPADPAPHRLLGEWAQDHAHAPVVARGHFEHALAIDPGDRRSRRKLRELKTGDPGLVLAGAADAANKTQTEDDLAQTEDDLASLMPPGVSSLRRDEGRPARRLRGGHEPLSQVAGAVDLAAILASVKPRSASVGLPVIEEPSGTNKRPDAADPARLAEERER